MLLRSLQVLSVIPEIQPSQQEDSQYCLSAPMPECTYLSAVAMQQVQCTTCSKLCIVCSSLGVLVRSALIVGPKNILQIGVELLVDS